MRSSDERAALFFGQAPGMAAALGHAIAHAAKTDSRYLKADLPSLTYSIALSSFVMAALGCGRQIQDKHFNRSVHPTTGRQGTHVKRLGIFPQPVLYEICGDGRVGYFRH